MELDAMILSFWMLSFKPGFQLSSFIFIKKLFSSSLFSAIRVMSSANLRLLIFLTKMITWISALCNSMKLWAMPLGRPNTNWSWWRVLTKHGPLEKGMAKHLSILALRAPWTIWKDAIASALCSGPENLVSQQNWWKDNLISSGRKEEQIGIQLELTGPLEPVSIIAFPLNDTDCLQKLLMLFATVLFALKNVPEEIWWELLEERACLLPQAIQWAFR